MALAAGTTHAAPARRVVESVRYLPASDYTRVVISLSGEAPYRLFTVPTNPARNAPARILAVFSPVRLGAGVSPFVPVQDHLLKDIRADQYSPSAVRVVLDVKRFEAYHAFVLHSPYRIIIDIRGTRERTVARPTDPLPSRRYIIMLDPGHGGHDPGAQGMGGGEEKVVTLALSKRLGRKLEEQLPVKVLFTRTDDVFVPLEERTARANAAGADLFVSIHANASTNLERQGVETYYLNNSEDRATLRLAVLENGLRQEKGGRQNGAELSYILSDLIQTGKEEESIALAQALQEEVVARARAQYPAVHNLGVKKGPFYVLVGAHMPCALVETAFITHRVEGRRLLSADYQEALAEGLFQGISRFLQAAQVAGNL